MYDKKTSFILLFCLFIFIALTAWVQPDVRSLIFRPLAESNQLTVKVKLQGIFTDVPDPSYQTKAVLYNRNGIVKQFDNLTLSYATESAFIFNIDLTNLNLAQPYALFIKPDKYFGKLFCSQTISGSQCNTPQFSFSTTNPVSLNLDLTNYLFMSGDIAPQDGKMTAEDLSKIISDLSKTSSEYMAADINSDHIIDTVDYSLALHSLSQNIVDESSLLTRSAIPTLTITPSTPGSASSSATLNPTRSPTPSPLPTVVSSGKCNVILTGKVYINALGRHCRIINETTHYCTTTVSQCNPTQCSNRAIEQLKQSLNQCANGIASLDETKTQINCQTNYSLGSCTPPPPPACEDSAEQC